MLDCLQEWAISLHLCELFWPGAGFEYFPGGHEVYLDRRRCMVPVLGRRRLIEGALRTGFAITSDPIQLMVAIGP